MQKTIVVTGAAGGLGAATTRALRAAGHRVVGADLHGADEELDVTDPAACRSLARRIMPDVWINNAGVLGAGQAADQPDAEIRRVVEVNLLGVIWGSRAATEVMRPRGSGHVINIGSLSSWITPTGQAVYAASKHGVRAFTVGLAAELTGSGLHVSLVCPDGIWTPMLYDRLEDASAAMSFTSPKLLTPEECRGGHRRRGREAAPPRDDPARSRSRGALDWPRTRRQCPHHAHPRGARAKGAGPNAS